MSFILRKHYRYSEEEMYEHICLYGLDWIYEAYKKAAEFKYEDRVWDLSVSQATHTPQSEKGAKSLNRYVKKLQRSLDESVPWLQESKKRRKRDKSFRRKGDKPESRVIIQGDKGDIPKEFLDFFKKSGAKVEHED